MQMRERSPRVVGAKSWQVVTILWAGLWPLLFQHGRQLPQNPLRMARINRFSADFSNDPRKTGRCSPKIWIVQAGPFGWACAFFWPFLLCGSLNRRYPKYVSLGEASGRGGGRRIASQDEGVSGSAAKLLNAHVFGCTIGCGRFWFVRQTAGCFRSSILTTGEQVEPDFPALPSVCPVMGRAWT